MSGWFSKDLTGLFERGILFKGTDGTWHRFVGSDLDFAAKMQAKSTQCLAACTGAAAMLSTAGGAVSWVSALNFLSFSGRSLQPSASPATPRDHGCPSAEVQMSGRRQRGLGTAPQLRAGESDVVQPSAPPKPVGPDTQILPVIV